MRKELRRLVGVALAHSPTETLTNTARINDALNQALVRLASEIPDVFFREDHIIRVQPDFVPPEGDTISVVNDGSLADPWCFIRDIVIGSVETEWQANGTWTGRVLLVTDAAGFTHRRTIRSIFSVSWKGLGTYEMISVVEPWDNTGIPYADAVTLEYKIVTDDYPLPPRIGRIKDISVLSTGGKIPVTIITEEDGRNIESSATLSSSILCRHAWRRPMRTLPGAAYTPTAGTTNNAWSGPHPTGTFEFCITHSFGLFDSYHGEVTPIRQLSPTSTTTQTLAYRRGVPLVESKPSESVQATSTTTASILLGLPDIDFMLGFGGDGMYRNHQSGVKTRIWVRPVTLAYAAGLGGGASRPSGWGATTPTANLEARNQFFLLDVVDGYVSEYEWRGAVIPDYSRTLNVPGCSTVVRISPRFSETAYLQIEGLAAPTPMYDDADAPPIKDIGEAALVALAAAAIAGIDKDYRTKRDREDAARLALDAVRSDSGTLIPAQRPVMISPRRISPRRRY